MTFEQRIAAALNQDIKSSDVAVLIQETEAAITQAETTAATEREKALDFGISPKAACEAMQAAEFSRDRLRTILPRLQNRYAQVQALEALARWHEEAGALMPRRDALAAELAATYPKLADVLIDLLTRIAAIDAEIGRLGAAPDGTGALTKVGIAALRDLQLPPWAGSREWPLYKPLDPMMAAPAVGGDARLFSGDWWQVHKEQNRTARERQEREAAEREAAALATPGIHWWHKERAQR